jgi:hypothetical protein
MGVITIKVFDGLRPVQDATLLKDAEATVALNTRLFSGSLAPLKGSTTLKALTKTAPQTIFRYGNAASESDYWLEYLADTDVMRSPVANDAYGRVYWTDGGTPKYAPNTLVLSGGSYPGGSYNLGVPAPESAPSITAFTASSSSTTAESRTYVYTYVTAYEEEGPPSAASAVVTLDPSAPVTVSLPSTGPSGSYNVTKKRIYRSSATGTSVAFQFVAEIGAAVTSYTDSVSQASLGEVLATENWFAPPSGLKGLKLMANGAAIGFKDNTAYLSEPNLPHAWPHLYPIDESIVGIGVFRQSAVLLTNSHPVVLSGADPQAMSKERMELPQACVSKRSIVDTGDGVVYASPDGLVSISTSGVKVLTAELLTREQWQAYNPSSISGFVHESRYHMFYTTSGGTRGMLVFDFSGQGATMQASDLNAASAVSAAYSDSRTDTLYMAQGTNIVRFNAGSPLTYTWRSKKFRVPYPTNFGAALVYASAYPVTLRVYADNTLRHTQTVTGANIFRLPGGFRGVDWQLEASGTSDVTQISMATSIEELRQV